MGRRAPIKRVGGAIRRMVGLSLVAALSCPDGDDAPADEEGGRWYVRLGEGEEDSDGCLSTDETEASENFLRGVVV